MVATTVRKDSILGVQTVAKADTETLKVGYGNLQGRSPSPKYSTKTG